MKGKKFRYLNVPSHWEQYWSRYPEGYTILEALIDWVSQVDKMVDNQNDLNDTVVNYGERLDDFLNQFDDELRATAEGVLLDWHKTGFLDTVIFNALDNNMNLSQTVVNAIHAKINEFAPGLQNAFIAEGEVW